MERPIPLNSDEASISYAEVVRLLDLIKNGTGWELRVKEYLYHYSVSLYMLKPDDKLFFYYSGFLKTIKTIRAHNPELAKKIECNYLKNLGMIKKNNTSKEA